MNPQQQQFLADMAKYIWWKTPQQAVAKPDRLIAQVMDIGTWDDLCRLVRVFPESHLLHILQHAEIGQFTPRSWSFWHLRLTDNAAPPPMPPRIFEATSL